MLGDEGTHIVKIFLNVSKQEQRERMQDRVDDPDERWKFRLGDLADRKLWDDYQLAFRDAIRKTTTDDAPWYIVPADRKWVRNLVVAKILRHHLEQIDPAVSASRRGDRGRHRRVTVTSGDEVEESPFVPGYLAASCSALGCWGAASRTSRSFGDSSTHRVACTGMSQEREILTWETFGVASRELAQMVADDGYEPDMILSIARGGLLIGGAMGYAMSVKNTYTMNVEFYTGVDERLEVPRILPPAPDFVDLHNAKILIVDDVADTGHTLKSVGEFCEGKVGEVRTAVIYEKSQSVVKCDYVWKRTDLWINFPWSDKPPVVQARLERCRRLRGGRLTGYNPADINCSRNRCGGTIPTSWPSLHTVTTGRLGLSRGSTAESSSSGSAWVIRSNGTIIWVSITHGR